MAARKSSMVLKWWRFEISSSFASGRSARVKRCIAVELFVEKVSALDHVLLAPLALEPLTDPLLGRSALDEVEPVPARAVRRLRGKDLDDLAVLQRVVQRDHAAIGLRADASMPDLCVDAVGEVHGGRVGRQVEDVTFRREDVDLVLEKVDL